MNVNDYRYTLALGVGLLVTAAGPEELIGAAALADLRPYIVVLEAGPTRPRWRTSTPHDMARRWGSSTSRRCAAT